MKPLFLTIILAALCSATAHASDAYSEGTELVDSTSQKTVAVNGHIDGLRIYHLDPVTGDTLWLNRKTSNKPLPLFVVDETVCNIDTALYNKMGLNIDKITSPQLVSLLGGIIKQSDIKSVTILKDKAAMIIWGSRAREGVIQITTW